MADIRFSPLTKRLEIKSPSFTRQRQMGRNSFLLSRSLTDETACDAEISAIDGITVLLEKKATEHPLRLISAFNVSDKVPGPAVLQYEFAIQKRRMVDWISVVSITNGATVPLSKAQPTVERVKSGRVFGRTPYDIPEALAGNAIAIAIELNKSDGIAEIYQLEFHRDDGELLISHTDVLDSLSPDAPSLLPETPSLPLETTSAAGLPVETVPDPNAPAGNMLSLATRLRVIADELARCSSGGAENRQEITKLMQLHEARAESWARQARAFSDELDILRRALDEALAKTGS